MRADHVEDWTTQNRQNEFAARKLEVVKPADAVAIASLGIAAPEHQTSKFGEGPWSGKRTEKGVLYEMRNASVYILRKRTKVVATLTLGTKKPWSIDQKYFSKSGRPICMTSMAVAPDLQRQGVGTLCVEAAARLVKQWPRDAIFFGCIRRSSWCGRILPEMFR